MRIVIREHEFAYDLADLDALERLDAAEKALIDQIDADTLTQDPTLETLSALYDALAAFFDTVLGDGALRTILDGRRNPIDGLEAYYDFRDMLLEGTIVRAATVTKRATIPAKYRPENIRK